MTIETERIWQIVLVLMGAGAASYFGAMRGRRRQGNDEEKDYRMRVVQVEASLKTHLEVALAKEADIRNQLAAVRDHQGQMLDQMGKTNEAMGRLSLDVQRAVDGIGNLATRIGDAFRAIGREVQDAREREGGKGC